jgi:hypothetical protein
MPQNPEYGTSYGTNRLFLFVSYNNRPDVTISFCLIIGYLLETTSTVRDVILA